MTDEWIKRDFAAFDDTPQIKGTYQRAIELLKQIVPTSRDIKITGVSSVGPPGRRLIADDERSLRLEVKKALLATPFGKCPQEHPPFLGILVCADDLREMVRHILNPPARVGAGRPPVADWDAAKQFAHELLAINGDPNDPANQKKGWRSVTDVANDLYERLEKDARKARERAPDFNTVRGKVSVWLKEWRARN